MEPLNRRKRREAHAKLSRVESDVGRYRLNRSGGVFFLLGLGSIKWQNEFFSVCTVQPLHRHLGTFKRLRRFMVIISSTAERKIVSTLASKEPRKASSCKTVLLNDSNSVLNAYKTDFDPTGLRVDLTKTPKSYHVDRDFPTPCMKEMPGEERDSALNTFCIGAIFDSSPEWYENPALKRIREFYFNISNQVVHLNAMFRRERIVESDLNESNPQLKFFFKVFVWWSWRYWCFQGQISYVWSIRGRRFTVWKR